MLKDLYRQYRSSGLGMEITLALERTGVEAVGNAIRDLGIENVKVSEAGRATRPRMRLVGPDGATVKKWGEFEGPAETGLEIRRVLGEPVYSQMQME